MSPLPDLRLVCTSIYVLVMRMSEDQNPERNAKTEHRKKK